MRTSVLLAVALGALAITPAQAQDYDGDAVEAAEVAADDAVRDADALADRLDDPAGQERIAETVGAMTQAIMGMPVGPLARAIEQAAPGTVDPEIDDDATLGDLAGRDARHFAGNAREQAREAGAAMGRSARALASAMPALVDALVAMRSAMDEAGAPYRK